MNEHCKECGGRLWGQLSRVLGICLECQEEQLAPKSNELEDRLDAALAVENKQEVLL